MDSAQVVNNYLREIYIQIYFKWAKYRIYSELPHRYLLVLTRKMGCYAAQARPLGFLGNETLIV